MGKTFKESYGSSQLREEYLKKQRTKSRSKSKLQPYDRKSFKSFSYEQITRLQSCRRY